MTFAPFVLRELLFKIMYVAGFIINVVGLVTGSALTRRVALPLCPGSLILLLFSWHSRLGWVNPPYAYTMLLGLLIVLFGDLIMAEPAVDYLAYPGFLLFCAAAVLFTIAVSLPTRPAYLDYYNALLASNMPVFSSRVAPPLLVAPPPSSSSSSALSSSGGKGIADGTVLSPLGTSASARKMRNNNGGLGSKSSSGNASTNYEGYEDENTLSNNSNNNNNINYNYVNNNTGNSHSSNPYGLSLSALEAVRIPCRLSRALLPFSVMIIALVLWKTLDHNDDGPETSNTDSSSASNNSDTQDPRFTVAVCFLFIHATFIWRAIARIGYQAPLVTVSGLIQARRRKKQQASLFGDEYGGGGGGYNNGGGDGEDYYDDDDDFSGLSSFPSSRNNGRNNNNNSVSGASTRRGMQRLRQQRAERNRRQAEVEAAATESRFWQWCGAIGAVCCTVGLAALGYDRLWLVNDPDSNGYATTSVGIFTYAHTLLSWIGQTLLAASVPCAIRPPGGLDDPMICPVPFDGPPLRVLIVLPGDCYDIAEVAIPWYHLTRRGHKVFFATRGGRSEVLRNRHLPKPADISLHGYGLMVSPIGGGGGSGSVAASNRGVRNGARGTGNTSSASSIPDEVCCACRACASCMSLGLVCSPTEFGVGIGAPGPLVVAMYREMLENSQFRRPLAWRRLSEEEMEREEADLARRARRKKNGSNRGGSGRPSSNSGMNSGSSLWASSYARTGEGGGTGTASESGSEDKDSTSGGSDTGISSNSNKRGQGDGVEGGKSSGSADPLTPPATVNPAYQHLYATPEAFDGVLLTGSHPASSYSQVWQDQDLISLVSSCWSSGKPIAAFSSAVAILPQCRDESRQESLLRDALMTGLSSASEWTQAMLLATINCRWTSIFTLCRRRRRGMPATVQETVMLRGAPGVDDQAEVGGRGKNRTKNDSSSHFSSSSSSALSNGRTTYWPPRFLIGHNPLSLESIITWLVTGDSPALRQPDPSSDTGSFVVEDGALLTAQSGHDAFLLSRRFATKLEDASTVF